MLIMLSEPVNRQIDRQADRKICERKRGRNSNLLTWKVLSKQTPNTWDLGLAHGHWKLTKGAKGSWVCRNTFASPKHA